MNEANNGGPPKRLKFAIKEIFLMSIIAAVNRDNTGQPMTDNDTHNWRDEHGSIPPLSVNE
jgi:hypothetical protein